MSTKGKTSTYDIISDSEDELDWEEVTVPQPQHYDIELDEDHAGPSTGPNIEVTLEAYPTGRKGDKKKKSPGGIPQAERLLRIDCHKVHTVALISNAAARNRWINDELLQARLLSLTPYPIQNSFSMIHKSRIPDDVKRGCLFEQAVSRLASWWAGSFFTVKPTGHLRNRTFEHVERVLRSKGLVDVTGKGKAKAFVQDVGALEDVFEGDQVEIVRSAKSLMKHALMRSGSRDVSSQLFTALCRALGIPARLVVSLQSVPWQTNVGRSKTPAKKKASNTKGKAVAPREVGDSSEDMEAVVVSPRNEYSSGDNLQVGGDATGAKSSGQRLAGLEGGQLEEILAAMQVPFPELTTPSSSNPPKTSNPLTSPPVFWTEVFSRPDCRWLPVDPIRAIVNKRKIFDPTPVGATSRAIVENRMVYVIAVEEDGYMRDVTPRYAKQYSAKVAKAQSGGKSRREWWSQVVQTVTRPYKLHRDDVEDDELMVNQFTEGMPTTMSGFKDHPFYVLERHLLRDQVISQDAHEIGKFRGESVYSRSQVLHLKAAENWMRHGRVVREGEQPLKYVKQHAATINRRRELEIRAETEGANGGGAAMQGLYAENQTEVYVPPPVIDGKIPKNNFGNIDLYTPSMLPAGAAYIPHKGAAKIARQLGLDYAEAVTSFEFRKGKAFPVISGIVVATDNEDTILEAYWETEHAAAQKEQEKRQQAALNRWTKLVQGLRIRQRIREQYGDGKHGSGTLGVGDVDSSPAVASVNGDDHDGNDDEGGVQAGTVGGFITGVEDVVQRYSLPRPTHVVFSSPPRSPNSNGSPLPPGIDGPVPRPGTLTPSSSSSSSSHFSAAANDDDEAGKERGQQVPPTFPIEDVEEVEMADMSGLELESTQRARRMPKSMAALAAEVEAQAQATTDIDVAVPPPRTSEGVETTPSIASRPLRSATRAKPRAKPKAKANATAGTPSRSRQSRKRTRTQDDDGDDDDDDEVAAASGGSGSIGLGSESGANGGGRSRAAKRTRKHRRGSPADANGGLLMAPVPPSDRVLRTRKGK